MISVGGDRVQKEAMEGVDGSCKAEREEEEEEEVVKAVNFTDGVHPRPGRRGSSSREQ